MQADSLGKREDEQGASTTCPKLVSIGKEER
jgi:hypothetical protein